MGFRSLKFCYYFRLYTTIPVIFQTYTRNLQGTDLLATYPQCYNIRKYHTPPFSLGPKGHRLLDLGNSLTGVEALRASTGAVEDSVASVEAHRVLEVCLALGGALITGISEPAVRLEQDGRAKILLSVPPVRRAGCGAACAENALVQAVQFLSVLHALSVFLALRDVSKF